MIKWIEENIAEYINNKKEEKKIIIWSNDSDTYRNNLLKNIYKLKGANNL